MPEKFDSTKYTEDEWEKYIREWQARYRNLFSTMQGKMVLQDMLRELYFFDEIKSEDQKVLSNYAKRLINLCGGWTFDLKR